MDSEFRFSVEGGLGFQGRVLCLAPNDGSIIVTADRQNKSGQRDPGSGVFRRSLVLLAVPGGYLLIAHEPLQLGGWVGPGGDALQLQVLPGCGGDLGGAGVVSNTLDDHLAWRFCSKRNGEKCEQHGAATLSLLTLSI